MIVPYTNMTGTNEIFVVHRIYVMGINDKLDVRNTDMLGKNDNFGCFLHGYEGD